MTEGVKPPPSVIAAFPLCGLRRLRASHGSRPSFGPRRKGGIGARQGLQVQTTAAVLARDRNRRDQLSPAPGAVLAFRPPRACPEDLLQPAPKSLGRWEPEGPVDARDRPEHDAERVRRAGRR